MRLFSCDGQQRTYWFDVDSAGKEDAFRACGILLGQAVLNNVLVPNIFPRCLFEKLLQELNSPCARPLWLEDVASVDKDIARTLRHVLDYKDDDIGTVYGEMGWQRAGCPDEPLSQSNKMDFVRTYVDWFFHGRVAAQFGPLNHGFQEILGSSSLLRRMVDAVQLERIICGGVVPVDVEAIRRRATYEGWTEEEEAEYLPFFWDVLGTFTEAEKVDFIVFVTASDRVPLRGWQDLPLIVQKNGVGDAQLPSAFTCFSQLLLPRYSSRERLRSRLLTAVANSEGFGLR
ncbi:unnamed protein product [Prorocentrum cordatum]|uniref:HECT-type E3 ubiquitin transferase n=1 Tax=Prorocentrum cordatum TaxID=2364126 RepID=A0ABN9VH87_9DINO|nr:unnamed protein product [Polarella glacialis]